MKITEAVEFLKNALNKTTKKSEIKTYNRFISILSDLENKNLTADQFKSIEERLAALNLNDETENPGKHIRKGLREFEKHLNKEYSFITEGYYTALGISLGLSFGAGIGLTFGTSFNPGIGTSIGLSMGTGIGMMFGIMYGAAKDAEAKKQNRVLKTKLD